MFKCGIIGLPNVGKSTLFNALTLSSVKAENFPFCTIKANRGFISVADDRLLKLSQLVKTTNNIIYGNIELIDIAGLIKGASQGEGLGNNFLNDIAEVDVLCHVVRCFRKLKIYHVYNKINPEKDIKIIHDELILSDISLCERIVFLLEKNNRYNDINNVKILDILKRCLIDLNNGILLSHSLFSAEEKKIIEKYKLLTFKPIIYIANIDNSNDNEINNCYLSELSNIAINENIPYLSMCFLSEEKFKTHNYTEFSDTIFLKKRCKFSELTDKIYKVLQLKTFFTINSKEVKSWIVSKNTTAVQAANMIHSDFKKNFIRVQVVGYHDFMLCGGWKMAKKTGKIKSEGKSYLICDGDILYFLI